MNTSEAFMMGELNLGKEPMVFDWDQAAKKIRKLGLKKAYAGLLGDLEWTCGCILEDGKPVTDSYTYLASTWAFPALCFYVDDDLTKLVEIPCYVMESETTWDADTKWPESALKILEAK